MYCTMFYSFSLVRSEEKYETTPAPVLSILKRGPNSFHPSKGGSQNCLPCLNDQSLNNGTGLMCMFLSFFELILVG